MREYEEQDFKQLYKFMLALCKLAGVTEAPDNQIIMLLIDHIQEHHNDFSKEEIQNAFSLAMAGKLDFEFNHYNRLTPQLISQTLNAYKMFRSKEIITYEDKLLIEQREEERIKNQPTPEKQIENKIYSATKHFNEYSLEKKKDKKDRKELTDWGNVRYDFLDTLEVMTLTIEEKYSISEEAKKQLISQNRKEGAKIEKDEFKQAMNSKNVKRAIAEIKGGNSSLLVSAAKQIALHRFYDSLIEDKKGLGDLLKSALLNHKNPMYKDAAKKVL